MTDSAPQRLVTKYHNCPEKTDVEKKRKEKLLAKLRKSYRDAGSTVEGILQQCMPINPLIIDWMYYNAYPVSIHGILPEPMPQRMAFVETFIFGDDLAVYADIDSEGKVVADQRFQVFPYWQVGMSDIATKRLQEAVKKTQESHLLWLSM